MAIIFDKLQIINDCLIATGNTPCNVNDDGSDEWLVASNGYERYLPVLVQERSWNFQTKIASLGRTGDSAMPGFTDVFSRPSDCIHIDTVWRTDAAALIQPTLMIGISRDGIRPPPMDYRIIGNQIHCCGPAGVTAKYVAAPNGDLTQLPPMFVEALRLHIISVIYAGLNEDSSMAAGAIRMAQDLVSKADSRDGQQEPRRALFRSPTLERRRGGGRWVGGRW